jgi:inosine/xanthosine triphosphate pyrophosphatase family protein
MLRTLPVPLLDPRILTYRKNSFAEMASEEKNKVSHRANALCKLREWFKTHADEL